MFFFIEMKKKKKKENDKQKVFFFYFPLKKSFDFKNHPHMIWTVIICSDVNSRNTSSRGWFLNVHNQLGNDCEIKIKFEFELEVITPSIAHDYSPVTFSLLLLYLYTFICIHRMDIYYWKFISQDSSIELK